MTSKLEGGHTVTSYSCEVFDMALLPPEYHLPDQTALNAIARRSKDDFEIPGCRLVKTKGITLR